MVSATREVLANREELGRIVEAKRLKLGWAVARVAKSLGVAGETIRAFEEGRGHISVARTHELLELLGLQDTPVITRPAKPSVPTCGHRSRREAVVANDRLIQLLIGYALLAHGALSIVAVARMAEIDVDRVKRLAKHEWFCSTSVGIQLTPAGRQAIG